MINKKRLIVSLQTNRISECAIANNFNTLLYLQVELTVKRVRPLCKEYMGYKEFLKDSKFRLDYLLTCNTNNYVHLSQPCCTAM